MALEFCLANVDCTSCQLKTWQSEHFEEGVLGRSRTIIFELKQAFQSILVNEKR